jgi:hypothetical protein
VRKPKIIALSCIAGSVNTRLTPELWTRTTRRSQQVIRGRYFVSYKPSAFELDGRYRAIGIKAEKEGHKLTVYARKGYYASPVQSNSADY